jgi:Lrp/AsnC family leucine-responsive transcriptional regulator
MDSYDKNILRYLQENARISNVDLSQLVHLSPPQTLRRLRALEKRGLIQRYQTQINHAAVGLPIIAFIGLTLDRSHPKIALEVEASIREFSEIIECQNVSGDYEYLLKVVSPDLKTLASFLTGRLAQIPGVAAVKTMLRLQEVKPPSALPLEQIKEDNHVDQEDF